MGVIYCSRKISQIYQNNLIINIFISIPDNHDDGVNDAKNNDENDNDLMMTTVKTATKTMMMSTSTTDGNIEGVKPPRDRI